MKPATSLSVLGNFADDETRAPRLCVGVNAGAYYVHQVLDIGLSSLTTDNGISAWRRRSAS
ncbi:MAG: hypothetical protein ACREMV_07945 [Gemmatimonadales bacterium]